MPTELDLGDIQSKTAFWTQKPDAQNKLEVSLFRCLIPTRPLETKWIAQESNKTVEGWLCKTSPKLLGQDNSPFLKAYCVLDLEKLHLLLCG